LILGEAVCLKQGRTTCRMHATLGKPSNFH